MKAFWALRHRILWVALGIAILLGAARLFFPEESPPGPNAPAPNWTRRMVSEFGLDAARFEGKSVLVHVWASWCPPCVDEIPKFDAFVRSARFPADWVAVAVSLDEKPEDAYRLLPARPGGPLLLVFDPRRRFAESLGSYQYPETFLINPAGEWIRKWVGPQDWERVSLFPDRSPRK